MIWNYIQKAGAECEGGFWEDRSVALHHDGSLSFKNRNYKVRGEPNKVRKINIGELSSPPFDCFDSIAKWVSDNWPDKRNATAGFHIHASFKSPFYYSLLMDKKFYDFFLNEAYDFARKNRMSREFFHRLDGKNQYCKKLFQPDNNCSPEKQIDFIHDQRYRHENPRYAQLNFCYAMHKTMECRLFPATMPKGKAVKSLHWYLSLIEDYIHNNKEDKKIEFQIDNEEEKSIEIDLTENNPVLV